MLNTSAVLCSSHPIDKIHSYGAAHAGAHGDAAWVMWPGTPYEHLHVPVGDHH